MIRRVLIPFDGSELAERVIPHLLRFVAPERTELLLMTALSSSIFPLFNDTLRSLTVERSILSHESEASEQVHAVTQQLDQLGFSVESQFLQGTPAESILRLSQEANVDLIAMSTHGRTGLGLALLGSVADEVVRHACPPVFLVPAQTVAKSDPLPRTILLPLDGSPLAETAIPVARQFAQNTGASIHLLRVVEPHDDADESTDEPISYLPGDIGEQPISRQAACYLERIRLRLQFSGTVSHCQIAQGNPSDAIVRIAHEKNADVIVMSTHARTGVERLLHGSVVGQVISKTRCPLLLMRGKVPVEDCERSINVVPVTPSSC
jgi:nucleotide-binding universal stress UspA family protein